MGFAADLKRFADKTESTVDESARAIKIKLFSDIVENTRVRTGRLKGNWQTSTGSPIGEQIERPSPNGEVVKEEIQNNVTSNGIDYLTNNLPYAEVFEEKDGMVAKGIQRIDRIVKEVSNG